MTTPIKPASVIDVRHVDSAVTLLRTARDYLAHAGCEKAAEAARVALRSALGAQRHVRARERRT